MKSEQPESGNRFRILALSGGGVRGLFQTHLLARIEDECGQPLHAAFDLCIGTSIGSINAGAAAAGVPFNRLLQIYDANVAPMFAASRLSLILRSTFRPGPVFNRSHLDRALDQLFGESKIKDFKTGFICTAGEISTFSHKVFSTFSTGRNDRELRIKDAIAASCSVPLVLQPYRIDSLSDSFVDGGIWANAPELLALQIAQNHLHIPVEDIEIVSIGTGIFPKGSLEATLETLRPASLKAALTALDMYAASQHSFSHSFTQQVLGNIRYVSINPILKSDMAFYDYKTASNILPALASSEFDKNYSHYATLFQPKSAYDISSVIAQKSSLGQMIALSGLSKIIPKRSFYGQFRGGPGNIESYLSAANHSIEMISISLSTGIGLENITRVFEDKVRKIEEFNVTVSLVDPSVEHLMSTITDSISFEHQSKSADELASEIRRCLSMLLRFKGSLPESCSRRFSVRTHAALPQGSAIILDRGQPNSVIQIETKPFGLPLSESYAIEVVPAGSDGLYTTFLGAYTALMEGGKDAVDVLGLAHD